MTRAAVPTPGGRARVVLTCGPAGSGKTTHARRLEESGYVRLSFDEEAWRLGHRDHPLSAAAAAQVHAVIQERLVRLVGQGRDVVVDTSFWSRASRDAYRALVAPLAVTPVTHYLATPETEVLARLTDRAGAGPHDVTVPPDLARAYLDGFEVPTAAEGPLVVVRPTDGAAASSAAAAPRSADNGRRRSPRSAVKGRTMSTTISKHGHACIRLEKDGHVLVLDPGAFSDPAALEGAGAVLVTHEHVDHVVPDRLAAALAAAPDLQVWAPGVVVDQLVAAGAPADRLHAVTEGDTFTAAGFAVEAVGNRHAVIHPSIPVVANAAYLVDGVVLHPGDSFTPPPAGVHVEVLLLPVSAPWMKLSEAADYLQSVAPRIAVPIHDAILSDAGLGLVDRVIPQVTAGVAEYRRLGAGDTLTV